MVAAVVSQAFFGNHPAFPIPTEYGFESVIEIVAFYPLLGILAGLVGVLFVRTYFGIGDMAGRARVPAVVLPMLGGLAVGITHGAVEGRTIVGRPCAPVPPVTRVVVEA